MGEPLFWHRRQCEICYQLLVLMRGTKCAVQNFPGIFAVTANLHPQYMCTCIMKTCISIPVSVGEDVSAMWLPPPVSLLHSLLVIPRSRCYSVNTIINRV